MRAPPTAPRRARGEAAEITEHTYADLRRLAESRLRRHPAAAGLQDSALVHEAWLRLAPGACADGAIDRDRFVSTVARAMRFAIVDAARRRTSAKRGGDRGRQPLDTVVEPREDRGFARLEIEDALARLAQRDRRQARIVELRFFDDLDMEAAARCLGVSRATAERAWYSARAWLRAELAD